MKLEEVVNKEWLDTKSLSKGYLEAAPFPHIVMKNFINADLINKVANEFPDLAKMKDNVINYDNAKEIKLASKGMGALSPSALQLTTYLNSDLFLGWLNELTGIKETLISDPYLTGGGYHEIKSGGLLKVHADFNKHQSLDIDRRLNLLIYLNKEWGENWGGELQLFGEKMDRAVQTVRPVFNTAVIFTTTSFTYHGHPDPLKCPIDRSRRSLAYYYYSTGRPKGEVRIVNHATLFKERVGENFSSGATKVKNIVLDLTPPIIIKMLLRFF